MSKLVLVSNDTSTNLFLYSKYYKGIDLLVITLKSRKENQLLHTSIIHLTEYFFAILAMVPE